MSLQKLHSHTIQPKLCWFLRKTAVFSYSANEARNDVQYTDSSRTRYDHDQRSFCSPLLLHSAPKQNSNARRITAANMPLSFRHGQKPLRMGHSSDRGNAYSQRCLAFASFGHFLSSKSSERTAEAAGWFLNCYQG